VFSACFEGFLSFNGYVEKMSFLYQDEKWLVVNKPSSISTHNSYAGDLGLAEWLLLHHGLQVYVCSRLDKETSGVLVFALTPGASGEAQTIHEENRSLKTYYFIGRSGSQESWVCTEPLDGKPCKTAFSQVKQGSCYSLYRAEIHRGRTHQIRRHASLSSVPILGDEEYGGDEFIRLCLHCETVQWPDMALWQAPVPQWFYGGLDSLSPGVRALAIADKRYPFLASVTDSCRLVHRGEMDVSIDKYGDYLCITGFDENLSARDILEQLGVIPQLLSETCGCRGGVVKTNRRDPHKRKLFGDMVSWGEEVPEHFLVREHGLQFEVSLNASQHVGLFLDQRDSRKRIADVAKDKRVANLFAFTCSFSTYAIQAGAREVFSVDLAAGCLHRGRTNMGVNGLEELAPSRFIKEDVRKWLARQVRKKDNEPGEFLPFDIIICDPPVFASGGKGKRFHVEQEWAGLALAVHTILSASGIALFANNHQTGQEKHYFAGLQAHFRKVTRLVPPLDFPLLKTQPPHVRIYWCEK
jgi:23S rRNA G2069 N7-methylase RlmK/C1962 C5-methylase RlmI